MLSVKKLLPVLIVALCSHGFAQEKDFGVWTTLHLEKEFTKKLQFQVEEELRLRENCTETDNFFTDAGVKYKFDGHFALGLYYRYYREQDKDLTFQPKHRLYADLSFKTKADRFTITFRSRLQSTNFYRYFSEKPDAPENYNRNKLTLSYNIRKSPLNPYVSSEMFCQVNNPEGNVVDKWRHTAGIDYGLGKHLAAGAYFMVQQQLHVNDPVTRGVLGFIVEYSL